jgi:uncharacterized protein (TIGR03066 family)
MRAILGGTLLALAVCAGAPAEDKKDAIDAKKLVGKWEPKEKPKDRTLLIEFTKDGKVTFTGSEGGKEMKAEGTYKVDGDKLTLDVKYGDKERKMTRIVSRLTDTELVSKEEGGKTEDTMVRVKDK